MKWNFLKKVKIKKYVFPCSSDDCLVRVACTKACEKIEMDESKLADIFTEYNCLVQS